MFSKGISIIICVRNGAKRIVPTLKSLATQIIPDSLKCELLIIDNASTDSTGRIAREYWESVKSPFPINVLTEPKPGKANALMMGYNSAKYELMLLCDDDNWLQPYYLKTVCEIFRENPHIGLLGGYGRALFEPDKKPKWFEKWENCYVCGKHLKHNGFLKSRDFRIWGAGSVLRKTMWNFLMYNGFMFHNSLNAGKAMTEDAELSMVISFTGHRLFFDDRLWFTHDLRGGRITWKNLLAQQSLNGRTNAILYVYHLAIDYASEPNPAIKWLLLRKILGLSFKAFCSLLKPYNKPKWVFFYHILRELISNRLAYEKVATKSFVWAKKIKNALPLSPDDDLSCY